ncbi:unnamed protein product [Owenia fusiformis]|uniref:Uncharacterized protein n=1 Tax=Owenia fusiformis TaxID=6347 RepID=A0A8S4N467_OWEFU|nr:unnamed protein product [Owenia fusiformis]
MTRMIINSILFMIFISYTCQASIVQKGWSVFMHINTTVTRQRAAEVCYNSFGYIPDVTSPYQETNLEEALANFKVQSTWLMIQERSLDWGWINGSGMYRSWASGQPNNYNGYQACAAMDDLEWWRYYDYNWNDEACIEKLGYICQTANSNCSEDGYFKRADNCYYVSAGLFSWFESHYECIKRDGYLVTIDSPEEQIILKTLLNENFDKFKYWIGLVRSKWSRKSNGEVMYTKWAPKEPSNSAEPCAIVQHQQDNTYAWYDTLCNTTQPLVCQLHKPTWDNIVKHQYDETKGYFNPETTGTWHYASLLCNSIVVHGDMTVPMDDNDTAALGQILTSNGWDNVWLGVKETKTPWQWAAGSGIIEEQGCFWDNRNDRTMTLIIDDFHGMTRTTCVNTCRQVGSLFAGLQGGKDCYCSDNFDFERIGPPSPTDPKCDLPCAGDETETCGGKYLNQVIAVDGMYSNWAASQPNNYDGYQACGAIDDLEAFREYGYAWNDERCNTKLPYICRRERDPSCYGVEYPMEDNCYFISVEARSWYDARSDCIETGGDLVTVHSAMVQQHITQIINENNFPKNKYWIGLFKGDWLLRDGQKVTFSKWAEGEPDERNGLCVQLIENNGEYLWRDALCTDTSNIVCDIRIPSLTTINPTTMSSNGTSFAPNVSLISESTTIATHTLMSNATVSPKTTMSSNVTITPNMTISESTTMATITAISNATISPNATMSYNSSIGPASSVPRYTTVSSNTAVSPNVTLLPNTTALPDATTVPSTIASGVTPNTTSSSATETILQTTQSISNKTSSEHLGETTLFRNQTTYPTSTPSLNVSNNTPSESITETTAKMTTRSSTTTQGMTTSRTYDKTTNISGDLENTSPVSNTSSGQTRSVHSENVTSSMISNPTVMLGSSTTDTIVGNGNNTGINVGPLHGSDVPVPLSVIIVIAVVGTFLLLIVAAVMAYCCGRRKQSHESNMKSTGNANGDIEQNGVHAIDGVTVTSTQDGDNIEQHKVQMRKHSKSKTRKVSSILSRSSKTNSRDNIDEDMELENIAVAYKDSDDETIDGDPHERNQTEINVEINSRIMGTTNTQKDDFIDDKDDEIKTLDKDSIQYENNAFEYDEESYPSITLDSVLQGVLDLPSNNKENKDHNNVINNKGDTEINITSDKDESNNNDGKAIINDDMKLAQSKHVNSAIHENNENEILQSKNNETHEDHASQNKYSYPVDKNRSWKNTAFDKNSSNESQARGMFDMSTDISACDTVSSHGSSVDEAGSAERDDTYASDDQDTHIAVDNDYVYRVNDHND